MAHESVASLLRIIESLLTFNSSMQSLFCDHSEDFSALHEKISSLDVVVKNFEKNNVSGEMKDLEVEVKEVESAAEYKIQLIVTEVVLGEVYNDACTRSHFDVCAWATVSQQHNVKEILLSLLRSTKGGTFNMKDEAELANMLQRSLKGKRYLIVLDDIWKTEAWDAVKLCFPSENKGSGILLMTRNTEVARYAGTKNSLSMSFMDQDESWSLFKSVAFSSEALPYEFETVDSKSQMNVTGYH
ncbi:hypothetical protein BC332_24502 [Capsicum chinense]|nr:hypothetical protein BC332_24502 [Capsicum chinense]